MIGNNSLFCTIGPFDCDCTRCLRLQSPPSCPSISIHDKAAFTKATPYCITFYSQYSHSAVSIVPENYRLDSVRYSKTSLPILPFEYQKPYVQAASWHRSLGSARIDPHIEYLCLSTEWLFLYHHEPLPQDRETRPMCIAHLVPVRIETDIQSKTVYNPSAQ